MKVYLVYGAAHKDRYTERVTVLEDMEEKPKSYVGNGRRIDKNKIGKLNEGVIIGSFEIALTNLDEIPLARKSIKEQIHKNKLKELNDLEMCIMNMNQHSLDSEITFR